MHRSRPRETSRTTQTGGLPFFSYLFYVQCTHSKVFTILFDSIFIFCIQHTLRCFHNKILFFLFSLFLSWMVVACFLMVVVCYLMVVVCYLMVAACYLMNVACFSMVVACFSMVVVCSPIFFYCSSFFARNSAISLAEASSFSLRSLASSLALAALDSCTVYSASATKFCTVCG